MRLARIVALSFVLAGVIASAASGFAVNEFPPPPDGAVGPSYKYVFTPKDGAPPYAFFFKAGDLRLGLKIEEDGTFHGTPTQAGTFLFDVEATQYCGCASQRTFIVKIRDQLAITTAALPNGGVGAPYTATLSVTGNGGLGMGWKIASGTLPPGLTIGANGTPGDTTISGAPRRRASTRSRRRWVTRTASSPTARRRSSSRSTSVTPLTVAASPNATPTGVVGKIYRATVAAASGGLARTRGRSRRARSPPGSPSTRPPERSAADRQAPASSRSPSL